MSSTFVRRSDESAPSGVAHGRREFLYAAAVAGGSLLFDTQPAAAEAAPMTDPLPIIDTHQHLWDLTRFRLPWLGTDAQNPLGRNFVMSDYLEAARGLPVRQTVYMEVDVDPAQQRDEVAYVTRLCESPDNPMAAAVVSGRPASDTFAEYVRELAANRYVRGIRQVLHADSTPAGTILRSDFLRGLKELGDAGLSFDLCMRPAELTDAVKAVDECRQTRFIVDHCGNMPVGSMDETLRGQWEKGMRELAARPNVVCKVSGIVASAPGANWQPADLAPIIDYTLDTFGEDRVMFASDWPVCTLRSPLVRWVEALRTVTQRRSEAFRRKLFHDNAKAFYRLT